MKKVALLSLIAILLAATVFVAVFYTRAPTGPAGAPEGSTAITDDFGRNVTVVKYPKRIVSMAPANTEILFALGLGDRVVGVTKYCDYPPRVKELVEEGKIAVIGGFSDPNIERVIALDPDLVLAAHSLQLKAMEQLEEKGVTVVGLDPKSLRDVLNDILLVGKITGKEAEAKALVESMERRIESVVSKVKEAQRRPRVYYEVWHDPLMSVGPGTWINELIGLAGGVNIFSDAKVPYPEVSSESIIARDPEIIVIKVGYMGGVAKDEIKRRPGWEAIDAVRNDRIYEVDENILIRPGPRIVDGLETLARIIHPELFRAEQEMAVTAICCANAWAR